MSPLFLWCLQIYHPADGVQLLLRRGRTAACRRPLPPLAAANQNEAEFVEGPGGARAVPCYCRRTSISVCECRIVVGAPIVSLCSICSKLDKTLQSSLPEWRYVYISVIAALLGVTEILLELTVSCNDLEVCDVSIVLRLFKGQQMFSVLHRLKKSRCNWFHSSVCNISNYRKHKKTNRNYI